MTGVSATSSVLQLRAALRAREVSSRELVEMYLARQEQVGAQLNAIVTLDPEGALAAADEADALLAEGVSDRPLLGVPFTVKDALETAGIASTGGSPLMRGHVPTQDAAAVKQLRDAGAVLFGKTNTPLYCGDVQTYNEVFGRTNNPWDFGRTTGGSSGGSAAAVAAGLTGFDVGTDLGGSLRIPAHFCGIHAHKPSYGVVDQRGYIDQFGASVIEPDVNVVGPLARSADDLALLLDVMHRRGSRQSYGWRVDLAPALPGLRECRVGVWFDDPGCPISASYAKVLADLIAHLEGAGVSVYDSHPAVNFSEQVDLWLQLISAAASVALPDAHAGDQLAGGHLAWIRRQEERARITQQWADWFSHYDVLLCPVWAREAFPHDTDGTLYDRTVDINGTATNHIDAGRWLGLIGVVGLPSTVVPIGQVEGMPVGVQVVAPYLHDRRAIRVAAEISNLLGGWQPPPAFSGELSNRS
ncbi:MAG: amidase, Asp-tRNAAsn/Glu-tRNAGln amidotransferase subunit [Mycobacterium sp.]|nr:amidase, Asp-tRNAAsn/Glu-tRNAGln amidotransferase subunit [Mycobacterium sp.]